jgi:hypothetical protein
MKNYLGQAGFCPSEISSRGENLLFFLFQAQLQVFSLLKCLGQYTTIKAFQNLGQVFAERSLTKGGPDSLNNLP